MLKATYMKAVAEAGCDEAGRGCLAGPVFAAAVILPQDYKNELLDDSKKLSQSKRELLREEIQKEALAYAVASVSAQEIDRINILNASILAMHRAISKLSIPPEHILVDGNRFKPINQIPYHCIVHGDALYMSIAAASVLAKTYRDDFMLCIDERCSVYGWKKNKGYPTKAHYEAIQAYGPSAYHRQSYKLYSQPSLF